MKLIAPRTTPRATGRTRLLAGGVLLATAALAACGAPEQSAKDKAAQQAALKPAGPKPVYGLPGMPPVENPKDLYAANRANNLSPFMKKVKERVYVPNTNDNTVSVIDPNSFQVVDTIETGTQPQHVVPSWDMKTLWVNNNRGHTLTPLDPLTAKRKAPDVEVHDPYNLYFTPNGKSAIVMASLDRELVFRDPQTMKRQHTEPVSCYGVNHADFSLDGRYFIVSCEFSAELLKVDTEKMKVVDQMKLPFEGAMPQDVKISPDGKTFYIADMMAHGMWVLDGEKFTTPKLMPTGKGCHGLYISRDSKEMFIPNRGEGSISVFDFAKNELTKKWWLPDGGSPDMGGVSADGNVLWLSGRYDSEVYAVDTKSGVQLARIPVGGGPHGLSIYPQPGRYSLGHTGIFR